MTPIAFILRSGNPISKLWMAPCACLAYTQPQKVPVLSPGPFLPEDDFYLHKAIAFMDEKE